MTSQGSSIPLSDSVDQKYPQFYEATNSESLSVNDALVAVHMSGHFLHARSPHEDIYRETLRESLKDFTEKPTEAHSSFSDITFEATWCVPEFQEF
jgi:hypothetical protein